MLTVVRETGNEQLAKVFVARLHDGRCIEFVESVQPPIPRHEKWVLILSTLRGCPITCPICDAGGDFGGPLTTDEILAQADHLVRRRYPDGHPATKKLKIQLARMGDPALNDAVLDALEGLADRYPGPTVWPSLSTVAPHGREAFFARLKALKDRLYPGRFQLQFSLHTTDEGRRRELVPARTWSFAQIAAFGGEWLEPGDRKVTLNFATPAGYPLEPEALAASFSPAHFAVKLTPVNPTRRASGNGLTGRINPTARENCRDLAEAFENAGFDTILSIGELDENRIGSNCGMYVSKAGGGRREAGGKATTETLRRFTTC